LPLFLPVTPLGELRLCAYLRYGRNLRCAVAAILFTLRLRVGYVSRPSPRGGNVAVGLAVGRKKRNFARKRVVRQARRKSKSA